MFTRKSLAFAIAAAGVISGAWAAHRLTSEPANALAIAPIDPALCRPPGTGGSASQLLFKAAIAAEQKLAQQTPRPEVKPFDYAVEGTSPAAQGEAVLFENLGTLSCPITTTQPRAQQFFDQGLRLCYAFNHAEALRAFRKAQQLDPECAMCYWGEVYALGPNINAPMAAAAMAPSAAALERAKALSSKASPREQALIAAIAERYTAGSYADAMTKVMERFPDDNNIQVLFAESIMMMSPWDYWQAGGAQPKGRMEEAILALERVLKSNPSHPGAIHFYIHAVQASTDARRAEPYAERLGNLMPGAGHLVHMPSHIYYRIGRYRDALEANRRAVAVDEAYFTKVKTEGIYPGVYYPHNVHFLMAAAQMAGDGVTVVASARKVDEVITAQAAREMAGVPIF